MSGRWLGRAVLLVALLTLMAGIAAGCGGDDDEPEAEDGSATEATDGDGFDGTIKVGFNVELSGPGAFFGASRLIGANVAVDDINSAGGVQVGDQSYQLELVVDDNRTDATYGVQGAENQAEEEVLWAVPPDFGFEAAYEIYKENEILTVANGGVAAQLLTDDAPGNPLLFFEFLTYHQTVEHYYQGLRALAPDVTTVAALLPDEANGRTFAEAFEEYAPQYGFEFVGAELHPPDAEGDFSTYLTNLKALEPDAIYLGYYPQVVIPGAEQAANLDAADVLFTDLYLPEDFAEVDFSGYPLISFQIAWAFSPSVQPQDPEDLELVEKLNAEAGGEPYLTAAASAAYIADVTMVAEAVEQAGTIDDPNAIAQALLGVTYDGPLGPATVSPNHAIDLARNAIVIDENGEVTVYVFDSGFSTEPTDEYPAQVE